MYCGRLAVAGTAGAVDSLTMDGLSTYADRPATVAAVFDCGDIADFTVDTGGRTVPELARFVLDKVPGWTNLAVA